MSTTSTSSCAIRSAITEIYGSGVYADEDDPTYCIKVGRAETEYVLDEVAYHIMMTRLEFARAEVRGDHARLNEMIRRWYTRTGFDSHVNPQQYDAIIAETLGRSKHARHHLEQLHELAKHTESYLSLFIAKAARSSPTAGINISIPRLPPAALPADLETNPHALAAAAGALVKYVNALDVSSIVTVNKTHIPAPPPPPIITDILTSSAINTRSDTSSAINTHSDTSSAINTHSDTSSAITTARAALAEYMRIANVAAVVERYHRDIIMYLSGVYDIYKKIIEQII
jgi:hypothetical protein